MLHIEIKCNGTFLSYYNFNKEAGLPSTGDVITFKGAQSYRVIYKEFVNRDVDEDDEIIIHVVQY